MKEIDLEFGIAKLNSRVNTLEVFFNRISIDITSIECNFKDVTSYCIKILELLNTIRNDIDNADSKILLHEDTMKEINKLKSELMIKQNSMKQILTSVKDAISM